MKKKQKIVTNKRALLEEAGLPRDLVSITDAAQASGLNVRTIWRKIREGKLRAFGTRKCYRISLGELLAPVVRE